MKHDKQPLFRREKSDPMADFWHQVRWGIAGVLVIVLIAVALRATGLS